MSRNGFTLVEVLVALVIFAIGALGLAAETAALTRQIGIGQRAAVVTAAATARLERARARACESRADGIETVRYHSVRLADLEWSWRDPGDSAFRLTLVTVPFGAPARSSIPADTLTTVVWCRR
jgi:prepilin-type N-terminal cleavage/methylation domain-containing protein